MGTVGTCVHVKTLKHNRLTENNINNIRIVVFYYFLEITTDPHPPPPVGWHILYVLFAVRGSILLVPLRYTSE